MRSSHGVDVLTDMLQRSRALGAAVKQSLNQNTGGTDDVPEQSCLNQIGHGFPHHPYGTVTVAAPGYLSRGIYLDKRHPIQERTLAHPCVAQLREHRQSALAIRRGIPMQQRTTEHAPD